MNIFISSYPRKKKKNSQRLDKFKYFHDDNNDNNDNDNNVIYNILQLTLKRFLGINMRYGLQNSGSI